MTPFLQFRFYCCCLLLLGAQTLQAQNIYLVDSARPLSNTPVAVTTVNTAAWASATSNLQAAITAAAGSGGQVWVAKGTYQPAAGESFSMKSNVKVYGGFVNTATTLSQRNFAANPTILKGNGSSVVSNNAVTSSALLDGFTITGGYSSIGGGILNFFSSPTLTNCTFTSNSSSSYGGGMYNYYFSSPTLTNCTFSGNSSPSGGGIYNYSSSPTLTNCTFTGHSNSNGGGIFNSNSSPTLTNCTFTGNSSDFGGGILNSDSSPTLTNCTFAGNSSNFGGGIFNSNSSPKLSNCILWSNTTPSIFIGANSIPIVTYSLVEGGYPGTGNLNTNPLFVNISDPDGADNIIGTADDGLRLLPGSPATNAGNNDSIPAGITTDITGAARIQNGTVDMGAYESPYSSYSITTTVAVTSVCAGSSLAVSYTAVGNYATGNVFTVQLSNAAGSFNSPVVIGSVTATTSGNITATIPAGTPSGSGYRVRVVSSGPAITGTDNGAYIIIDSFPAKPVVSANGPTTFCAGDSVKLSTPAAGNTWTQKADFGGALKARSAGFNIGSKGYTGTGFFSAGNSVGFTRDFWEYDTATNAWTQKADFLGYNRIDAVGFSIGSIGYMGLGSNGSTFKDFYAYNPSTNSWTRKADFGGTGRSNAVGFSISNKGYIGTGGDGSFTKDFWEYDPVNDTWTRKADFGGSGRYGAVGFSIGGKGYIGTGYDGNPRKDFWEYNPISDSWQQKADFGGQARLLAVGFTIGNKGYLGTGTFNSNQSTAGRDFWEYNPAVDAWIQKSDFGGTARSSSVGFSIGNKGYIGTGLQLLANLSYSRDFWGYEPGSYSWSPGGQTTPSISVTQSGSYTLTVTNASGCSATSDPIIVTVNPLPAKPTITFSGPTTFCAGDSVRLSAPVGMASYLWSSGATTQSIVVKQNGAYSVRVKNTSGCTSLSSDIVTVNVNPLPAKPVITAGGSTTFCAGGSVILSAPVGFAAYLWSNGATTQSITAMQSGIYSVRVTNSNGCGATSDAILVTVNATPAKPVITSSGPTTFCAGSSVNLSSTDTGNAWIQKADFGGTARYLAASFSIGNKGYIGTGSDNNTLRKDFWEYNPTTNAWTQKADFGGTARIGAVGFSIGSKGYIGTGGDNVNGTTKDFWEYDPSINTWAQKADFAGIARYYATGFSIGSKGYIGTGFSDNGYRKDLWEYDPATNTWVQRADFGGTARLSAISFSISNKGYVGTGDDNVIGPTKDFWEYNPANNAWTQKADLGGGLAGIGAVGFSIGSKGYIGTGNEGIIGKNFWEYDPTTNNWTRRADFGGMERGSATGFSIGSKGYIGTGGYPGNSQKDFWEYNPSYTYSWSPGGQTTPSISVTQSGTYTLTVTNASGCSATSDTMVVRIDTLPKPTITRSSPTTFCAGDSVKLSAPAGFAAYQWSSGATTQSITVTQSGAYSVKVKNTNGCISPSSDTIPITVNPLPAKPVITVSGPIIFNSGDSVLLTAPAGFARYQWSNGDTTRSIVVKTAGSYTVTVTNSNGCTSSASDSVIISLYSQPVIFVSVPGAGNGSGLNWANALPGSQISTKMLTFSGPAQFWVKAGTYYPTQWPNGCYNCNSDRDNAYLLRNNVGLYGGFAGTESLLSQRIIPANPTILSGNIGNPGSAQDNAYHVVLSVGSDSTARLDGFTISNGNANGYGYIYITVRGETFNQTSGGGIFNSSTSPLIANCTISNNSASSSGGGMNNNSSSPIIRNSTFATNSSSYDGGAINNAASSPVISYSKFLSNTAASNGGAIANSNTTPVISNCTFSGNSAYSGGGVYNNASSATIISSAFAGNTANTGGGVANLYSPSITITNAVFAGNSATQGGAIYNNASSPAITNSTFFAVNPGGNGWSLYNANATPVVTNSVIWSNSSAGFAGTNGSAVQYSLIKGGYSGIANLDADPLFVNIADPDGADDVLGTADDGLALQPCSPGINSGDNAANSLLTDIAGRPRIYNNTIIDRGAYEYQAAAATFGLAVNGDAGTFLASPGSTTQLILDCRAIGQLLSTGASPVNGLLTAKAWVDATQTILPNGQTFIRRHYEITPAANATAATARITLYATQQEFDDFNTISATDIPSGPTDVAGKANLRITKYSGQSSNGGGTPGSYPQPAIIINPDDNDIVWNSSLNRWEITIPVTGFSGFFIGNGDIILPVTLLSFTGKALPGNEAALNWRTTSEVNTGYFELQRSTDGRMFTAITQLTARGNSQSVTDYSYTDKGLTAGLYYYRLRMVDKDGKESYSGTVTVSLKGEHLLTLYPVPAKKEIWLNGTGASRIGKTALLLDVQGRILQSVRIAQWPQRIEVTALAAGTYLVKVAGEKTVSFVKE